MISARNKSSVKGIGGKKIYSLVEGNGPWSYPANFTPGALRLVKVKYLISTEKAEIVLCEFPDLQLERDDNQQAVPDYVALSHVWKPSPAIASRENQRPLHIVKKEDETHEISWLGLMHAAIAAKHLKCKYLWLDFICINQTSNADKGMQIKNMSNIYGYCRATVIMLGGMRCAPRLEDESFWHTRAWTLQETIESIKRDRNAVRYILFEWNYDNTWEVFRAGFQNLDQSLAIVPLRELLDLSGGGMPIRKIHKHAKKYRPHSYGDPIEVPVRCFGDKQSTSSLLPLLFLPREWHTHYERDPLVWRQLWIRTSSKEHDILYSAMNLFTIHIPMEIEYAKDFESVMTQFLDTQHKILSVPHWLKISHRIPVYEWSGLLPKRPNFQKHEMPAYLVGQSEHVEAHKMLCSRGCCSSLDLCVEVAGASKENGHTLCAKVLKLNRVVKTETLPTYTEHTWQHVRKIVFSYSTVGTELPSDGERCWTYQVERDAEVNPVDIYSTFDKDTTLRNEYDIPTGHPVAPQHNAHELWIRSCTEGADLSPIHSSSQAPETVNLTALCWLDGVLGPYFAIIGFYNSHYQNPVVYFLDFGKRGTLQRVGTAKLLLAETDRIRDDIPWTHVRTGGSKSGSVFERCNCERKPKVPEIKIGEENWADEWLDLDEDLIEELDA